MQTNVRPGNTLPPDVTAASSLVFFPTKAHTDVVVPDFLFPVLFLSLFMLFFVISIISILFICLYSAPATAFAV